MSTSAPKFASFQPKPKPKTAEPEQPPLEKPRDDRQHTSRSTKSRDRCPSPPPHQTRRDPPPPQSKTYFSDRRGDVDILKYGTLHQYDIPVYRRSGYGHVLGLPHQKIDREYSTEKKLCMTPLVRPRQKRMLVDRHASKQNRRTLRLVKAVDSSQPDTDRDFIALSATSKQKQDDGNNGEQEDDLTHDLDYRGIDDKRDPNKANDPDTYYESDTEAATAYSETTKRNSELIRATRDDPQNLQAWLHLVQHQEPMMKLDRAIEELTTADKQHLAQVRISTYEDALRKIGDNKASQITLLLGLLQEARQHWDVPKLTAKWQHILTIYPYSVQLWFGYLDFAQSTFAGFKYEACLAIFHKALAALQPADSSPQSDTAEARLHLFIRLTRMMQEAGYQELALAIWQAVLELNLFAPHGLTTDKLQQFEEFFESEAPRAGEPDSKGWRHTSIDDVVPPACNVTLSSSEPLHVLEAFGGREMEFTTQLRYPGRSTDDVAEDDPFHTVFFSDLKDYVTAFPAVSAELCMNAFLSSCGLPGLADPCTTRAWEADPFLQNKASQTDSMLDSEGASPYQTAFSQHSQSQVPQIQMTSDLLIQQQFSLDTCRLSQEFIRTTLRLVAREAPESEMIGEYLLAFEARYFPTAVAKTAKQLLKDRPSSLRLYHMYGLIEGHRDNPTKADQILGAALNISSTSPDRLQLHCSYVWQAMQVGDMNEALWRLTQSKSRNPSSQPTRPDDHLLEETRSTLQIALESILLAKNYTSAVLQTSLLALFVYLSNHRDASAALETHNNLAVWFTSHKLSSSSHAEVNAQAIARLLSYHATHTPIVKPALLRNALEPLIATFPNNTVLLSTYAANEARFSIDDRVRGNMSRVLNTSTTASITTWAFAIHHETLKSETAGSTSHSIRALYKRATALDAAGAHCPSLWTMYLRFELTLLHKEQELRPNKRPRRDGKNSKWQDRVEEAQERVRATFYAGLKMLPWCKEFIMLAFTQVREVFSHEELARLYKVMLEKELRVYVEVDELDG